MPYYTEHFLLSTESAVLSVALFTLFTWLCSVMMRRAKWNTLGIFVLCFVLCILRMLLPVTPYIAEAIHLPAALPNIHVLLIYPFWNDLSLGKILLAVWIIVTVLLLARLAIRLARQARMVRATALAADHPLYASYRRVAGEVGCSATGRLCISRHFTTPMMAGFFRPHILLPTTVDMLSESELSCAFRHELAHFSGHDLWLKLLSELLCCLFWWNPVVYTLRRSTCHLLELRSDARVCRKLSDPERIVYTTALLKVLRSHQQASAPVATGYEGEIQQIYLKRRFNQVLFAYPKKFQRLRTSLWMLLVVCIFLGSYTFSVQSTSPTPDNMENYTLDPGDYEETTTFLIWFEDGTILYVEDMIVRGPPLTEEEALQPPYSDLFVYPGKITYEWEEEP